MNDDNDDVFDGHAKAMARSFNMRHLDGMDIEIDKKVLLEALKTNAKKHKVIVQEARAGYLQQAENALQRKLAALKAGKYISLTFKLSMPQDYSEVYETAIGMLEQSITTTVKLTPEQYRQLMLDDWEWTQGFLLGNAGYSQTAAMMTRGG